MKIKVYPLVMTNIAMENGPFTDGLPIENGGFFHGYVSHNQMVRSPFPVFKWDDPSNA